MSVLSKIFSVGASQLVSTIGNVVDNLHTSTSEKLEARRRITDLIKQHEAKVQEEVTNRWESDMKSDSSLAKNVRPAVLVFLIISTVLLVFIDSGTIAFTVADKWVDLLQLTLLTVIGAYFGGRSMEKIKNK